MDLEKMSAVELCNAIVDLISMKIVFAAVMFTKSDWLMIIHKDYTKIQSNSTVKTVERT